MNCTMKHFLLGFIAVRLLVPLAALHATDIPQSVNELWADFDPRKVPLETEDPQDVEQDGVVCRLVRYQVGVFKGTPLRVAAFYAFPKGGNGPPALLDMHGGGQSASLNSVVTYAKRGYAGISINWGGNKMESSARRPGAGRKPTGAKADATHPPTAQQGEPFRRRLRQMSFTLDTVESPRNSNWFLVLMAARRAITFLEQQPEVDPSHWSPRAFHGRQAHHRPRGD